MIFVDRLKFNATGTSTAALTLGTALASCQTLVQAIADVSNPLGLTSTNVPFMTTDGTAWEETLFNVGGTAQAPTLTRVSVSASSAGGTTPATFSGPLTMFNTPPGSWLSRVSSDTDVAFASILSGSTVAVPLTQVGTAYVSSYTVAGPLTFTPAANAVKGAYALFQLIADGANVPDLSAFPEVNGTSGYDNRHGIRNDIWVWYDGARYRRTVGQDLDATPTALPATAITLAGPTTGTAGTASSNFTVAANGSLSGTVVVTPSDGGKGGTFNPTSISLTDVARSGTFTYTASAAATDTISVTNNGGLTNPATISYAAAAAGTSYLQYGSLTRVAQSGSGPFTYAGSGAGAGFGSTEGDAVLTKAFQAGVDGEFVVQTLNTPGSGTNECLVGIDPSSTTNRQFTGIQYSVVGHSNAYAAFTSGNLVGNFSNYGAAAGNLMKVSRVGSVLTVYASINSGGSWQQVYQWTGVSTGVLYIHMLVTGVGSFEPISQTGLA